MTVVNLNAARERRETEAWQRYVSAKSRADATLDFADGKAAALAWRAFIELYQSADQTDWMGGSVRAIGGR